MHSEKKDNFFTREKEIIDGIPIIAISGPVASGKWIIAEHIEKTYGFYHLNLSEILIERLQEEERQPPFTRSDVAQLNLELQNSFGKDVVIKMGLDKIEKIHKIKPFIGVVIEGNRHFEETLYLDGFRNIILIWIDASIEERFRRNLRRGRSGDITEFNSFLENDSLEKISMRGIRELSHLVIVNEGPMSEKLKTIDLFIESIFQDIPRIS